ncbi:MAG: hypothetical protein V3T87_00340 [Candidatus Thorarchaeota archaeon]
MQTLATMLTYSIILFGLALQFLWLALARKGRDAYVRDLTHFRKPSNPLARYYSWRVINFRNALLESLFFEALLLLGILVLIQFTTGFPFIEYTMWVVIFIMTLSFMSGLQMSLGVRTLVKLRSRMAADIGNADDFVGKAKDIVEALNVAGRNADGRLWFVLFEVAQEPNPVGYSARDVLLSLSREPRESPDNDTAGNVGSGVELG